MITKENQIAPEVLASTNRGRGFKREIIGAVLKASRLLGLAIGTAVAEARRAANQAADPWTSVYAKLIEANLRISMLEEQKQLLAARFSRVPPHQRPHYSPSERFRGLRHQETYGLTVAQTAAALLVSEQTIARWTAETTQEPDKETVGSLVKPVPPLMRYSDAVRDLTLAMTRMGFGGSQRIAQTLARAGVKLNRETVRRWRNKPAPTSAPVQLEPPEKASGPVLKAKRPNRIWMLDITEIRAFFGLFTFKLAVILDVFSRMPLTGQLFLTDPTGLQMADFVGHAAEKHGPSNHFVTDQGTQFTSDDFCNKLETLGIKQRFGAVGKSGSIAIIERFWLSLKTELKLKLRPPLICAGLHERLMIGLFHYAYHRPHQGLAGATPAEVYYGLTPACSAAVRPRRAYEKDRADDGLFKIAYLDPERVLPVLIPKAA